MAEKLREHLFEMAVAAWPAMAAVPHERDAIAHGDVVPRGGLGFELVQITPGYYLPESLMIMMRIARAEGETYGHRDLTAATVRIQLPKPDRDIMVEGGTLASGDRDSRGRREVVEDTTVAFALRSLMEHMISCEEHGWRVDTQWPWEPQAVPARDRTLKRIKQRMRTDWWKQNERILQAATLADDAWEQRKSATLAIAKALHVSERSADDLIREARDAGYLPEERDISHVRSPQPTQDSATD